MSIASELANLAANRDAIKAAIESKNPAVPTGNGLASFPASIKSISTDDEWQPPSDWPNLRTLLQNDTEDYDHKMYALYDTSLASKSSLIAGIAYGYVKCVTSDGGVYVPGAGNYHSWSQDASYGRFRWIAWYSSDGFTRINISSSNTSRSLLWVVGTTFVGSLAPSFRCEYGNSVRSVEFPSLKLNDGSSGSSQSTIRMFTSCVTLFKVPDVIDMSGATSTDNMFTNCACLSRIPSVMDMSSVTSAQYMFQGCASLKKLPSVFDTSSLTYAYYMFYACMSLRALPSVMDLSSVVNASTMFQDCRLLEDASSIIGMSSATNTSSMFSGCYSLVNVPDTLDISSVTNSSRMFNECSSLSRVPAVLDLSSSENVTSMFRNCYSLTVLPDVIDLSSVTSAVNQNAMFEGLVFLKRLPTHVTSNWSLSFYWSSSVDDKDSVATFDDPDSPTAVTGGFVGNLNTCPNSGQTITLNLGIKGLFSATEQSIISAAMTAKNWTLSW